MTFIIMGTCGEYSAREVWPACVVEDEAVAKALVERFQSECRALLQVVQDEDPLSWELEALVPRLFGLMPDPSFPARFAANESGMLYMIEYQRPEEWTYYYEELLEPWLGAPLTDARAALGIAS